MQQVITMPIKDNEILCSKCDEKIDPPYIVRYDGRDFHHSCFTAATTETTDMKRNPHITMTINPHMVKVMLEAMEGFLDNPAPGGENNARLRCEVKDAYADVALRLSQAGRNIAQCHHCNRARYYSGMVRGGTSKEKIPRNSKRHLADLAGQARQGEAGGGGSAGTVVLRRQM